MREVYKVEWRCDSCKRTGTILVTSGNTSLAETVRRSRRMHAKRHHCGDPDMIVEQPVFVGQKS